MTKAYAYCMHSNCGNGRALKRRLGKASLPCSSRLKPQTLAAAASIRNHRNEIPRAQSMLESRTGRDRIAHAPCNQCVIDRE